MPENAVFVGRPSKWGNPYKVELNGREKAVELYEQYLTKNSRLMAALPELVGKDLVCFCSPLLCHGNVLCKYVSLLYK